MWCGFVFNPFYSDTPEQNPLCLTVNGISKGLDINAHQDKTIEGHIEDYFSDQNSVVVANVQRNCGNSLPT